MGWGESSIDKGLQRIKVSEVVLQTKRGHWNGGCEKVGVDIRFPGWVSGFWRGKMMRFGLGKLHHREMSKNHLHSLWSRIYLWSWYRGRGTNGESSKKKAKPVPTRQKWTHKIKDNSRDSQPNKITGNTKASSCCSDKILFANIMPLLYGTLSGRE